MRWIDGVASDHLPADDRGLQFGDGLFETIAVVDHQPRLLERHLARLHRDAEAMGLPAPDSLLIGDEARALAAQGAGCGVLKIIWTAGSGGRGYARPATPQPRRLLSLHSAPTHSVCHWQDGVSATLCHTRLGHQPALAGIKHLNRLEQVLARCEWATAGAQEGIMLDQEGLVVEGSMSNLFAVRDGAVITPPLNAAGIAGVMREAIISRLAEPGQAVVQEPLSLEGLASSDEVFLCNSVNGVWPVRELQGHGRWAVGPLTRSLQDWIDHHRLACTPATRTTEGQP